MPFGRRLPCGPFPPRRAEAAERARPPLADQRHLIGFRRQHPGIYPNPAVSVFFDTLVMGDAPATFTVIKLDGSIAPEIGRHLVRATADFYLLACSVRPQCPIAPANGTVTFRN